ncbi:MAG: MBL fold metallo-hydrolase [Methylococcales bacterium]|nr:MBL fold metallo-hydrolase [Methylococcales bacterium]
MIFRQLFEEETSTFSYLLGCERTRRACLIDSVASELDTYLALLDSLKLKLVYTLETHVHADHITGAGMLREITGSKSVVHKDAGARCADLQITDGELLQVGDLDIEARHTPGHTNGCVSYVMADRVFTGDALLIGGSGRTDFQQGNPGQLYDSITGRLFTLPADTLVYPGHDYNGNTVSTIRQEMASNRRLGRGRSREDFVAMMQALKLDYPKYIDRALPANQSCGLVTEQY